MDQAEQLRNIFKKQNKKKHLARVITVTSGKGGVGKSNVSLNLAIQFSRLKKRVVVFDADFGLANIEVMLGIRPAFNLADVIYGGKKVSEIITNGPEGIGLISGGSGIRELVNLTGDQIQLLINLMYELDDMADIVIIDTGAGISSNVMDMVLSSSEILLVATPEPTSITDAYALLKTLKNNENYETGRFRIRVLGNKTLAKGEGRDLFDKLNSVVAKFLDMEMEYIGSIPYDSLLMKAIMKQQPVSIAYPKAPSSKAIYELALVLDGGSGEVWARAAGISGLFARMFGMVGR